MIIHKLGRRNFAIFASIMIDLRLWLEVIETLRKVVWSLVFGLDLTWT